MFCTRGHCVLDLCNLGHLLVKTNIPFNFKCSSLKHSQIISFLVLKVIVTMTMTFAHCVIYWWGTFAHCVIYWWAPTSQLSLMVLSTSIAKLSSPPGDLDLCPQDHLLVRTNISTMFEGPNHKNCRITSFFGTKNHRDFDRWLSHLLFRSILPISLIVLGLIIANGFLLYVCLFVLRFYGPVNPMGSCRVRSVYLTTRLLGRLSPLRG